MAIMTVGELISELQWLAETYGEDTPVKLAEQPSYPFQYELKGVAVVDEGISQERIDEALEGIKTVPMPEEEPVIMLVEGRQEKYLSKKAKFFIEETMGDWSGF